MKFRRTLLWVGLVCSLQMQATELVRVLIVDVRNHHNRKVATDSKWVGGDPAQLIPAISKDEVYRIRKQYQSRTQPWADMELNQLKSKR
ncbi:MAG: hypothetical protein CMO74_13405 [Verrucomicrobiales bacterium]|nr:hypothetical protein [Verrucomicrobiales bacterium]|tara:strand:+ start:3702 stop:3968 length:267 start_codon:yes stop_codon:yes gene_type:complete